MVEYDTSDSDEEMLTLIPTITLSGSEVSERSNTRRGRIVYYNTSTEEEGSDDSDEEMPSLEPAVTRSRSETSRIITGRTVDYNTSTEEENSDTSDDDDELENVQTRSIILTIMFLVTIRIFMIHFKVDMMI